MPRLLVNEADFRLVHDQDSEGRDLFILERREEDDAMGEPRWGPVQTKSTRIIESLYRYILRKALEADHGKSE